MKKQKQTDNINLTKRRASSEEKTFTICIMTVAILCTRLNRSNIRIYF